LFSFRPSSDGDGGAVDTKIFPVSLRTIATIIRPAGGADLQQSDGKERGAIQIQGTIHLLMDDHLLYVTGMRSGMHVDAQ